MTAIGRQGVLLALALMFTGGVAAVRSDGDVAAARDLRQDAAVARAKGLVLLLIVSRSDCGYCQVLKREVIRPMLASGDYDDRVLVRELLLDDPAPVTDFDGRRVSAAALAGRYDEWLTPTVLLLGPDGAELAPRRRGLPNLDFYPVYLDRAISRARAALPAS